MTENEEFEFRHRLEQEQQQKPGLMDILPQVMQEAASMGAPNLANQMTGDLAASVGGLDEKQAHVDPQQDTTGLQDVSIPDAMVAGGMTGSAVGAAGKFMEPQLGRIARNQTMKSFGGSMRQIRQMAKKGDLDASAQLAREQGLADVFSTSLGREKALEALEGKAGQKLGALRTEGGASPLSHADLEAKVNEAPTIQKFLGNGLEGGQKGDVSRALEDIKRVSGENPTFAGRANAATEINKSVVGNKEFQPTTAATEVANILSRENNAGLASALGPEKAAQEAAARKMFSDLQPLKHLQEHGELREMSGTDHGLMKTMGNLLPTGMATRATAKGAAGLSKVAGMAGKAANYPMASIGGVTSHLMSVLSSNPQSLGKYASPLLKASQTGGKQGLAATHYILSTTHPDYNQLIHAQEQPED